MGLAVINLAKNAKEIPTKRFFLDATYYWDSYNHTTPNVTNVKASGTYTSSSCYAYGTADIRYFILGIKDNSTFTTSSTITVNGFNASLSNGSADAGNDWSWTGKGTSNLVTYINPTVNTNYLSWIKHTLTIGQVLYSDGALSANLKETLQSDEYSGRTAIGLVFSTTTSTTDNTRWKHGYAWALKDAASNVQWQSFTTTTLINASVPTENIINDKDGYTKSYAIKKHADDNYGGLKVGNYTALYYALNYNMPYPPNSSGWFLQSSGQMHDISINLGGLSDSNTVPRSDRIYWPSPYGTTAISNFNAKLQILIDAGRSDVSKFNTPTGSSYSGILTSTERSASNVYEQYFVGYTDIYAITKANEQNRWIVRPILAF